MKMNKPMELNKCCKCGHEYTLNGFATIMPKDPDNIDQCHPFMEMEYVCIECFEKENSDKNE